MKKLFPILFISLFIFSCDDDPVSPPLDECGVSGGDNSTCIDECGVPNGDNSTCTDECGVVNGDNSCVDECGVPNGDNTNECGSCSEFVSLWGVCYNIQTTTQLDLSYSGLTGEIPSVIGNLINLNYLDLRNNQLTGVIPIEICNLNTNPILRNNHLCPPYPECLSEWSFGCQGNEGCEEFPCVGSNFGIRSDWWGCGDGINKYVPILNCSDDDLQVIDDIISLNNIEYLDYFGGPYNYMDWNDNDIIDPIEEYNVVQFQKDFQRVYSDITKRRKLPILCGGTGFYIKAVLMDFQLPETEPDIQLRQRLKNWALEDLINELEMISPETSVIVPVDPYLNTLAAVPAAKAVNNEVDVDVVPIEILAASHAVVILTMISVIWLLAGITIPVSAAVVD